MKAGTQAQTSREAMRSLTPYLQQTGLRRPGAEELVRKSTDLAAWYRRVGSTTRGLYGEVGNDLATVFQRASWEKAWQRPWRPGLLFPQGLDAFSMRTLFAETAGADELARVRSIPAAIRADATVTPHLETMGQAKAGFVSAGAYSTFDVVYVQTSAEIEYWTEPTPAESLRVPERGATR